MFLCTHVLSSTGGVYRIDMRILSLDYASNLPGSTQHMKGGTERFARDFSAFVTENGHEWIGVIQGPPEQATSFEECGTDTGKEYYRIASRVIESSVFADMSTLDEAITIFGPEIKNFKSALQTLKPDLVFLNGFIPYSWLLLCAVREEGIPVVFQHAGILVKEMGQYSDIYAEGTLRMTALLEKDATESAAVNIFLNEHSKNASVELVKPARMQEVFIIPLPDAGWDYIPSSPVARVERSIGVVARWDRIKNHPAVLALAKEIHAQGLPWTITAVTTVPNTMKNLPFKKEYKEHVHVIEPMDHDALRAFYREQDVCILPSIFETAGGVVSEALAEGTPTLISNGVGWVDEYKATGMESWITDFSDPVEVVTTLQKHLDASAWPEVRRLASHIQEHHNPEIVFTKYLSVFESAVK